MRNRRIHPACWLIAAAIMMLAASIERWMGRSPFSPSGRIMLWVGQTGSPENSQQLIDWYSFTHVVHGMILFALIRLLGRKRWSAGVCLIAAVLAESSWEVLENSPIIIERYRQTAIAAGYYGDSILNSMSDIAFTLIGYFLARTLPVWVTVTLAAALEVSLALLIRDNLTLNVIMLLHRFNAIQQWQMGAG